MNKLRFIFLMVLVIKPVVFAQEQSPNSQVGFDQASEDARQKLEESMAELARLREEAVAEKVPLSRMLSDLENQLAQVRLEYQQATRLLDNRTLDLGNLRNEIRSRQEETAYLSNLLSEYTRNFESRLHIAEIQRYREPLKTAKLLPENSNLMEQEIFQAQIDLLVVSLDRLHEALGGARFQGTAVDSGGLMKSGTFLMIGPVVLFKSEDGKNIGTIEQRLGSLEPAIVAFGNPADAEAAAKVISESSGMFPMDPTLGNAHKVEQTKETLLEHVKKGGAVMYPIILLAGTALIVAFFKWLSMAFIRAPSRKKIRELLGLVAQKDEKDALRKAAAIGGPVGKMLTIGMEHIKEPRELIEELMYEQVLAARLRLQRMLPFIALTSSSAPLLGLLGTVTGIMNTFTLMTVFGTGDIKTLSSGISEALITTEFGLYVAIPSLLMYAFLSRKSKSIVDEMEKAAVAFINQVSKTPCRDIPANRESGELVGAL